MPPDKSTKAIENRGTFPLESFIYYPNKIKERTTRIRVHLEPKNRSVLAYCVQAKHNAPLMSFCEVSPDCPFKNFVIGKRIYPPASIGTQEVEILCLFSVKYDA